MDRHQLNEMKGFRFWIRALFIYYVLSLFLAGALLMIVVHQYSIMGALQGSPGLGESGTDIQIYLEDFIRRFGNNHRNFSHGLLHGALAATFFALPIIVLNGLQFGYNWKNIWVQFGYWLLTLTIMGGVICHFF